MAETARYWVHPNNLSAVIALFTLETISVDLFKSKFWCALIASWLQVASSEEYGRDLEDCQKLQVGCLTTHDLIFFRVLTFHAVWIMLWKNEVFALSLARFLQATFESVVRELVATGEKVATVQRQSEELLRASQPCNSTVLLFQHKLPGKNFEFAPTSFIYIILMVWDWSFYDEIFFMILALFSQVCRN